MTRTPKALTLAGAALLLGATSACSAAASTYADLDEAPPADKTVPADLPEYALEEFDADSVRWVGDYADTDLWLSEGSDDLAVCLLAYANADDWVGGCAGSGGTMTTGTGGGPTFFVVPDGHDAPSDATQVSNNVYAVGG